ncbi:hypothetical protein [Streptomyces cupreus]|uniref:IS1 family transposase n=1 Tax=Streptomyces cupreus TaxID=2759956 RepID=A0A7X1J932_9ACTN|nr:hypothetical protein [Streptomyces cupreus]MBC2906476.1 hypothetical protein [Streptomyces cupreus]
MSERAAPFYCPYCGDEDLRPSEQGHGAWECAACNRAFQLKFLGLLARGVSGRSAPVSSDRARGGPDEGGAEHGRSLETGFSAPEASALQKRSLQPTEAGGDEA